AGDGIDVELVLQKGAGDIPENAVAVVANRSAIGEQYLDLQPADDSGPYLRDGSRIEGMTPPPQVNEVVDDAITLTESVPTDDLHTVVTELGKAFNGQADNLTRLIDSLEKLSKTGVDDLDQTISLIRNADPVLGTQAEQSDAILDWSKNLELITAQLASSDPAVRRILSDGQLTATELSSFLQKHGDDATSLIHQLGETVHTIEPATFSTGMLFYMLSSLSASSHTTGSPDGQIHFGIVLETNHPAECTRGYESTAQMIKDIKAKNPDFDINTDDFPFNTEAGCKVPVGNPTSVRGGERAVLSNPAYPQPWDDIAKKDPDKLNLNPVAQQMAALMGIRSK
ncbi:mammalian cell entry protein, partial [Gordonia sp. VNK21]|uniref:mammalian cell entry protein n=1 Tax=Gordonia sp. VNK21 TaxID=3382483 RepID=UPI0038D50FE3